MSHFLRSLWNMYLFEVGILAVFHHHDWLTKEPLSDNCLIYWWNHLVWIAVSFRDIGVNEVNKYFQSKNKLCQDPCKNIDKIISILKFKVVNTLSRIWEFMRSTSTSNPKINFLKTDGPRLVQQHWQNHKYCEIQSREDQSCGWCNSKYPEWWNVLFCCISFGDGNIWCGKETSFRQIKLLTLNFLNKDLNQGEDKSS